MPMIVTKNELPKIAMTMEQRVAKATLETAVWIDNEVRDRMSDPKSGRIYKVSKTGAPHQASAPGEAPAMDTGNLAGSLAAEQIENGNAMVYSTSDYAQGLEFGTAKMAHRPFFAPAAFKAIDILWKLMKRALSGE